MRSPRLTRPHTITLFNQLSENCEGEITYQKTVIRLVRVNKKYTTIEDSQGKRRVDSAVVTIDMNDLQAHSDGKPVTYINDKEFAKMVDNKDDTSSYFTFQNKLDFIVEGEISETDYKKVKEKYSTYVIQEVKPQRSTGNGYEFINLRCYE